MFEGIIQRILSLLFGTRVCSQREPPNDKTCATLSYLSHNILFKYIKGRICIMMSYHKFCIRSPVNTLCYLPCSDVLFYMKLLSKNVVQAYILIMPAQKRNCLENL